MIPDVWAAPIIDMKLSETAGSGDEVTKMIQISIKKLMGDWVYHCVRK